MTPETMIGIEPIERSKWVICQRANVLRDRPVNRISRVSTFPISRPTANMATNEPRPRGMLTSPLVSAG